MRLRIVCMAPALVGALACRGPATSVTPEPETPGSPESPAQTDAEEPPSEPVVFVEQAPAAHPTDESARAVAPEARPTDEDDPEAKLRAKQAFAAGTERYRSGDYAGALDHFEQAYADYPMPELQFNIGRCLEKLGRTQEACAAYAMVEARTTGGTREGAAQARAQLGC